MRVLKSITARNFRSLRQVDVELQDLSVLVGPNGSGKTTLLEVIQFLGDTARLDLAATIEKRGGFHRILFRGERASQRREVTLGVTGWVTSFSSPAAVDEYELAFLRIGAALARTETLKFKRTKGQGRRITVSGSQFEVHDDRIEDARTGTLAQGATALSTLRRLGEKEGARQVDELAVLFESFRVFEVDVDRARRPARIDRDAPAHGRLASNAENLAAFLDYLHREHRDRFERVEEDLAYVVPGLSKVKLRAVGGAAEGTSVELKESGLAGATPLADASFGTVRALALFAMLHDPAPPRLSCVEEIDHGLHPYALDRIVERLRSATERTQILLATHSPALVNRLDADELIVCERDVETGASRIPAIDSERVREMERASEGLGLGELWFSGALGGVP